ncbi:uncharacterized protein IUM83_18068 [Phytophthora cinnamomi]|uniref:uncharacterized protein n=1 Tax=Phytophthora cinnamomi TaxID=4785 RepID=UPI00355A2AA0|nr:hypothetical protein IUM83_18068 [Phytophthora cinnamomi]
MQVSTAASCASPRHIAMLTAAQAPADFEMLCEQLVFQGVGLSIELAQTAADALTSPMAQRTLAELSVAAANAAPRAWNWLQLKIRREELQVTKEEMHPALQQPAVIPIALHSLNGIAEGVDDVKTLLQLLNWSVIDSMDKLQSKQEADQRQLCQRLEALIACSRESVSTDATPSANKCSNSGKAKQGDYHVARFPSEAKKPTVQRLELPVAVDRNVGKSSIVQDSAALLQGVMKDLNDFGGVTPTDRLTH